MVGNFVCSGIKDGQAADILIRHEGLQISLEETGLKSTGHGESPVRELIYAPSQYDI